jgi:hypothetical protein
MMRFTAVTIAAAYLRPHPEERALARVSKDRAAPDVAILRDAALRAAPQDEA